MSNKTDLEAAIALAVEQATHPERFDTHDNPMRGAQPWHCPYGAQGSRVYRGKPHATEEERLSALLAVGVVLQTAYLAILNDATTIAKAMRDARDKERL